MIKLLKLLELFGVSMGIAAVTTLLFFLMNSPYKCIIPFEPILWIRIIEIMLGNLSLIVLIKILINIIKNTKYV